MRETENLLTSCFTERLANICNVLLPLLAKLTKGSNWHAACSHLLTRSLLDSMSRSHPTCDRHGNLQMVPCWVKCPMGIKSGHVCPVPGCGRYYVDETYLNAEDVELVVGPKPVASTNSTRKKAISEEAGSARPPNRRPGAGAAILRAIREKQLQ